MAKRTPDQLYLATLFDGATDSVARPAEMVCLNENRSCADLYRMIADADLELRPPWQRELVWSNEIKTRFLDSLARGMPIPSVMICHDIDTGHRHVIDGLQRMSAIKQYFESSDWIFDSEPDIDPALRGRPVRCVRGSREVHKGIINTTLPVTTIRYRSTIPGHTEHLFTIFYRVNSGSVRLNTQEIRNAIYQGRFNDALRRCDDDLAWRAITKRPIDTETTDRFAYREIVLRAFALVDRGQEFSGTLNTFLNRYMADMKNAPAEECRMRQLAFENACALLVRNSVVDDSFHSVIADAAVKLETLLYGVIKHYSKLSELESDELAAAFHKWAKGDCLKPAALSSKLYGKETLMTRLAWTDAIFGEVLVASPTQPPLF